ncbi:LysR family transcriptional regulator [Aeromonas caviae]|jgi:LysR family transcriptional regulator for metE and metH|uniref:LysR substrate-binding domain-containing protein n=1 Tax=Aeromonas TaxID=642 RepID=UPI000CD2BF22|nr:MULTISPECIES: LysR substrate-binding domain-containing protein [Aeromonas]AUV12864.1 LysR family transcriptional regulator [Aeromonas sp. ASNIH3]MBL0498280.1 LysR family transcriptional regulator [Aeromonas caviae]MDX7712024.1 LysR substrate-binding domain-containing protein [Aeromonas caviae]BBQ25865.1 XRE family transcriptional regulator [Aeromonas sp. WP2-W18-CRE-05]BBT66814.1 XRE family transcriptional regulator [Aeromonas caviae]
MVAPTPSSPPQSSNLGIDLKHLKTISALAEQGSLAGAALTLNLTQSALSHQLKELETRLNLELFLRKSRPLVLTAAGQHLLALARQVLPALAQTERQLFALHSGEAGRLHLALDCHSCIQWLLPLLPDFRRQWPGVDLEVESVPGFDAISALLGGQLDLLLTSDVQARGDLHFEPLFAFDLTLVMAPDHPLCQQRRIAPDDLRPEVLLVYPVERARMDVFSRFLQPAGVEPARCKPVDNTSVMLQMAAAGLGLAALPRWASEEFVRQGLLEARPLGEGIRRHMYGAVRAADKDQACLQSLFERIRTRMAAQ